MNLTTEQKKHVAALFAAYMKGEDCELHLSKGWQAFDPFNTEPSPLVSPQFWRIAPKKVVRPWAGPDDVPGPVCWIRWGGAGNYEHLIGCVQRDGIKNATGSGTIEWASTKMAEYSTDRKTWKPCTVEEQP